MTGSTAIPSSTNKIPVYEGLELISCRSYRIYIVIAIRSRQEVILQQIGGRNFDADLCRPFICTQHSSWQAYKSKRSIDFETL